MNAPGLWHVCTYVLVPSKQAVEQGLILAAFLSQVLCVCVWCAVCACMCAFVHACVCVVTYTKVVCVCVMSHTLGSLARQPLPSLLRLLRNHRGIVQQQ